MVVHVGEPIVSVDRFCPAESHDDDVPVARDESLCRKTAQNLRLLEVPFGEETLHVRLR
jgi:hypothetical protein